MVFVQSNQIKEGDRIIVVKIDGNILFQNYLLAYGITVGSVLVKNYSPSYASLVNLTIGGKLISLRRRDFRKIQFEKI